MRCGTSVRYLYDPAAPLSKVLEQRLQYIDLCIGVLRPEYFSKYRSHWSSSQSTDSYTSSVWVGLVVPAWRCGSGIGLQARPLLR